MTIKAISFDLDDTLWHTAKTIDHAEQTFQRWIKQHLPELGIIPREQMFETRKQLLKEAPHLTHQISELRRRVITHLLEKSGHKRINARKNSHRAFDVFLRARQQVFPFEGVEAALCQLKNEYTLGVITNGNANVFLTPLGRYFDFGVSAEKVAQNKPGPKPFETALIHANCRPEEMLHIGDHHDHDMAGALAMGMPVLWFNPQHDSWPGDTPCPPQFSHFDQLPTLVRQLS